MELSYPSFNLNNKLWLELRLTSSVSMWHCRMRHKSHKISPCHLRHFIWISACTKCAPSQNTRIKLSFYYLRAPRVNEMNSKPTSELKSDRWEEQQKSWRVEKKSLLWPLYQVLSGHAAPRSPTCVLVNVLGSLSQIACRMCSISGVFLAAVWTCRYICINFSLFLIL